MTTAPILTAEDVLVDAIKSALAPYVGTFNARPKAYYQQAEQGAPQPFIVFHFQTDIGRLDYIDQVGAETIVTLKALAPNGSTARDLVNAAAPAMDELSSPGYTITARYRSTPPLPPTTGTYYALHTFRLRIERA